MSHSHHCVSCGHPFHGRFCPHCGEKRIEPHDLTLRHFAEHAVEAFTHADGKIFRTIRSLIFRPGEMTADYLAGRRRFYIGPLQLFLICNVLYFLLLPFLHWDSLTSTLETDMDLSFFKSMAKPMVLAKLAAGGTALEDYRLAFDHAAILHGKSLVIFLVPLYTLPLFLIFRRKDRPFVTHLVFALHLVAFFLLLLLGVHELINLLRLACQAAGYTLTNRQLDWGSSIQVIAGLAYYFHRGIRRTYQTAGTRLWLQTAALVGCLIPVLTAYRVALFLITLRST